MQLANLQFSARLTRALLDRFDGDPQAVLSATNADLVGLTGFLPKHAERLRDAALAPTSRQMAWVEKHGVRIVLYDETEYPRALREIPDPPPILFVRGALLESDRFGVGIVGSRHATPYGRATSERFARELAGNGLAVVSGGAVGIDAAAHRGALAGGGRTIAFLGCGLDVDYPREHRSLFEEIAAHGALVSEYPLGAQPESWRFPLRNRLISGMALGVLVVEAPRHSGALITATFAVEHGRVLMTVPSNIDRESGVGSNDLLKDGATPVTQTEDILRAIGMMPRPARPNDQRSLDFAEIDGNKLPEDGPAAGVKARSNSEAPRRQLSEVQGRLLETLSLAPKPIDAVAQEAGLDAVRAGVELTLLELNGLVRRLPGNSYIRSL